MDDTVSPAITDMLERGVLSRLNATSLEDFLQTDGLAVLFFTGGPKRFRESHDVAVALREITRDYPGQVRSAVLEDDLEAKLRERFRVITPPSLVFVAGGKPLEVVPGVPLPWRTPAGGQCMSRDDLIPAVDLDSGSGEARPGQDRPNPMIWEGEEAAQGIFTGAGSQEEALALLGMPSLELPRAPRLPEDFEASPALRGWLSELRSALATVAQAPDTSQRLDLTGLQPVDVLAIEEILGEGEVDGHVNLDGVTYHLQESVMPGIWRITVDAGEATAWVEVAAAPSVVTAAAASLQPADYDIPAPGGNVMNAPPVLAEISERSRLWQGDENHVINFTLLPMSEADHQLLTAVLGRADLEIRSRGFGDCRIMATRYRNVWAVQFVNAMEHTILDTVEIGTLPPAACAAREDFEDSGERLAELMETYLS